MSVWVYRCVWVYWLCWTVDQNNMIIRSVEKRATEPKNRPKLFPPKKPKRRRAVASAEEMVPTRRDCQGKEKMIGSLSHNVREVQGKTMTR